ncbi:MAG: hypothetical protein HYR96_06655 [Deltaproteobacteria bacterium]|nr:hypothetical protein [Deltaproteobacteria bacterium]MBI3296458.1 hypothetical protein [Deltaproteobacteria bacterium]
MDKKLGNALIAEQLKIMDAAATVLSESAARVAPLFQQKKIDLSVEQRESCEALTARFARLCDFFFQRVFRTIDQIELTDDGTAIDRLNRAEKRGLIGSAALWRQLRELRNDIAHEYLIERSDRVLAEALQYAAELIETARRVREYIALKGY